jgi:hypothetical protein
VLTGERPDTIARAWETRRGPVVEPPATPDSETLARIRATRAGAAELLDPIH